MKRRAQTPEQLARDAALARLRRVNRSLAVAALIGTGVITDVVANTALGSSGAAHRSTGAAATVSPAQSSAPVTQGAPTHAQSAPVTQSAPTPAESAPVTQSAPTPAESAPVTQSASTPAQSAPVTQSAPTPAQSAPVTQSAPTAAPTPAPTQSAPVVVSGGS